MIDAVVFDLDGVVTRTAEVHFAAWKEVFDEFLHARLGDDALPFTREEYREHVDGKPRLDGVRAFLDARGIALPGGEEGEPSNADTVNGLASRKNARFHELLEEGGVEIHEDATRWLRTLRVNGVATAIVSSSRNASAVLRAAGLDQRFDAKVDGTDLDDRDLPGKPDPAIFEEAARRLGVDPGRAVAVEDAVAGVEAARRGGFGLVVGVDRRGGREVALREAGADVVTDDLGSFDLPPRDADRRRPGEPRVEGS